jgi:predicted dehydrogenase
MASKELRIGIAGAGSAALAHAGRLRAVEGVILVGCADVDTSAAASFAARVSTPDQPVPAFADHSELLRHASPDALAIFTPHPSHYRPAMDALQAGCHVFIEKPLSTNVQEAVDIVGLARGRSRKVAVGHHFRLLPSLIAAKAMLAAGAIGRVRLVTATLAQPWLDTHQGEEHAWRFDPRFAGGGILADSGIQLIDALLWTCGQPADLVSAIQARESSGLDLVTSATIRLADGTPATLAISGASPGPLVELVYHGEKGRLRATDLTLTEEPGDGPPRPIPLPEASGNIDANFVAAILGDGTPCCPADQALDSVRLLEAIARSATIGQFVGLA